MLSKNTIWKDGIIGLAVGDALGVPVEFASREYLKIRPVENMRDGGLHNQPKGTWSDDTSMTVATLDSLKSGYSHYDIADKFCEWAFKNKYTAGGTVFDIGGTTERALKRYKSDRNVMTCGGTDVSENGNGALMRILPICLYCHNCKHIDDYDAIDIIFDVTGITHAHIRSKLANVLYYFICSEIIDRDNVNEAVTVGLNRGFEILDKVSEYTEELKNFDRLRDINKFARLPENEIESTTYVVHTLEAVIWCLLNTDNYAQCVLKAVNLGNDTDTIGAIAGGLAGVFYGYDSIPKEWLNDLVRRQDLELMCTDPEENANHNYANILIMPKKKLRFLNKISQVIPSDDKDEKTDAIKSLLNFLIDREENRIE